MKTPGKSMGTPTKRLAFLGLMAALLFAQEAVLSFLPNIQATFLLVLLYGACVGMGGGTLIVTVHVLLDNLLFGVMSPFLLIPMWLGYELTLFCGWLLRRRTEYAVCVAGILCSLVYCLLFAAATALMCHTRGTGFALGAYLLADLPFAALLVGSTALSVLFLYAPLYRLLSRYTADFCKK